VLKNVISASLLFYKYWVVTNQPMLIEGEVDERLFEIAIIRVARLNACHL